MVFYPHIFFICTDFTKNVENSKVEAELAKANIPEIRNIIYAAEKQTRENKGSFCDSQLYKYIKWNAGIMLLLISHFLISAALHGAKDAASRSLLDADEAKTIAEKASNVFLCVLLITMLLLICLGLHRKQTP